MSKRRQLDALSSLLAGEAPRDVNWMAVLTLANETFVTPQIYAAALAAGTESQMPADVRDYLREVWTRNRVRNRRLFAQLRDAVAALNAVGIDPMLLKGAGYWASIGRPAEHDRVLIDLDLLVEPAEEALAISALEAAGFVILDHYERPDSHVAAELGRPQDVALIDLHRRPPGPKDLAAAAMTFPGQMLWVAWDGVRARAPSPALQVFLLVLHDQFHDGGYWRGEFSFRHLQEIAALSRKPGGVDWAVVAKLAQPRLVRNATDAQLLAAARMCGALIPRTARRPWIQLQHARRCAQFGWPHLNSLFRMLSA